MCLSLSTLKLGESAQTVEAREGKERKGEGKKGGGELKEEEQQRVVRVDRQMLQVARRFLITLGV